MSNAPDVHVDLNADLAEGFGRWSFGTDDDLLDVVTSANVACGFHAGDPSVIRHAVARARDRGVRIGAHVGYPDLLGFGRRRMDIAHQELVDLVLYQLSALAGIARTEGTVVSYVKPHGALYNTVIADEVQAAAVAEAVRLFDAGLAVMSLPGSAVHAAAEREGLPILVEAFADRAYLADGTLAPRSVPGAVLHDPEVVAARVVQMVTAHGVAAVDGSWVDMRPDSVCVHGDSAGAVDMARRIKSALTDAGVAVGPSPVIGSAVTS